MTDHFTHNQEIKLHNISDEGDLQAKSVPATKVLTELDKRKNEATLETVEKVLKQTRQPPQSLEAERCVLGGIFIDEDCMDDVLDEGLHPGDFYSDAHNIIFQVMLSLNQRNEPITTITTAEELLRKNQLNSVGGVEKISQLESIMPMSAHVRTYCRIIKEKATLRNLIKTASNIVEDSYQQSKKVSDIIDFAEQKILSIGQGLSKQKLEPMSAIVMEAMKYIDDLYHNKKAVLGVPSGFSHLDNMTTGFNPGDLVIIAGRPSMGKTALALNIASHMAIRARKTVAFFSLEMSATQLVQRIIGSEAGVDLSKLKTGSIKNSDQWRELTDLSGVLSNSPLYIDETPGLSIAELKNRCRRLVSKSGVDAIFIDYLQLMSSTEKYDNKATEVGEISKGLKNIARELKVPVITLSQLNRGVENRTDKRPLMSDLRESGSIEQDADIIMFLYREEYYLKDKCPDDKKGITELIVSKHRNGPTGVVNLNFASAIAKFRTLETVHTNQQ